MREIYAHYARATTASLEDAPPSRAAFRARVRAVVARLPWLVCEIDGAIAGYAYAGVFNPRAGYRWTVEVSLYVRRGFERRGIGRALYDSLFRRLTALGYCRAVAVIGLPNPASVGLHESLGFRPVGVLESVGHKFGEWRDVGWWQLQLRPPPANPAPPKTPREIADLDLQALNFVRIKE